MQKLCKNFTSDTGCCQGAHQARVLCPELSRASTPTKDTDACTQVVVLVNQMLRLVPFFLEFPRCKILFYQGGGCGDESAPEPEEGEECLEGLQWHHACYWN